MSHSTSGSGGRSRRSGPPRGGGGRGKSNAKPSIEPLHPIETPPDVESFRDFALAPEIVDSIEAMDITKPTPIQALAIGPVLEGRDVIAKAETGTGKTLAFGAPMISQLNPRRASVLGLVLSPTRELAEQVYQVLARLGRERNLQTAFLVGGEPIPPQVEQLKSGSQVVVGTPGRVLDLLRQRFLSFPWTEFVVLDEADKMLEIGFLEDIQEILRAVAPEAQKLMFSATFPPELLRLARQYTNDPVEVATASGYATVDTITQYYFEVDEEQAFRYLSRIIEKSEEDDTFIVFCPRRTDVNRLMRRMERKRYPVKALHGGYEQEARFAVMEAFRRGDVKALVATDVASRGLDIHHVTHVVNFGSPRDIADYTHRIGRTGRAGREGTAITFVFPNERRTWGAVRKGANWPIERLEEPADLFRPRGSAVPAGEDAGGTRASKGRSGGSESSEGRSARSEGPSGDATATDRGGERQGERSAGGDRPSGRRGGRRRRGGKGRRRTESGANGDAEQDAREVTAGSGSEGTSAATGSESSGSGSSSGDGGRPKKKRRRRRRRSGPSGDSTKRPESRDSDADAGRRAGAG